MSRTSTPALYFGLGLLFVFTTSLLQAQSNKSPFTKVYVQTALGAATHNGMVGDLAIQTVLKNSWTASLSYHYYNMNPKNLPDDFTSGYTVIFFIPIPDIDPETELTSFNITGGKYFKLGKRTWATTEAGLSFVNGDQYTFRKQAVVSDGWFYTSANYATTKNTKTTLGGLLKADITWAFASFAGLGVGAFANINSIQSPVGGEIKLMLGWMNRKPKVKS